MLPDMPSLPNAGGGCPKHSEEPLKYYCQQFDELVCADCLALEPKHQGHPHERADKLVDTYRSNLLAQIHPIHEMNENAQSALKTMQSRRKEITNNGEAVKEAIKMTMAQVRSHLEMRELELLEETDKLTQQKLKQHDAHGAHLESLAGELSNVLNSVTQTTSDNSNSILYQYKPLSDWLLEASRKFQSLPKEVFLPLQGANIGFLLEENAIEVIQGVGSVTERRADASQCYIDVNSVNDLVVNKESTVHLMMCDSDGKPYNNHVKGIKVDISSATTSINCDILIEQDSSKKNQYNLKFVPSESGQFIIKVKIGSVPVKNSPLVVEVNSMVSGTLVGDIKGVLQPYGITVNGNDEIIVVENGKDSITVFRSDGKQVRMIQSKGKIKINRPRGVTITKSNNILITDDDGLKMCSQEGKHLTAIGKIGAGRMEFSFPCGLTVSNDGKIYVCDTFNDRIQVLNPDLTFSQFLGNDADSPTRLNQPHDIAFTSNGNFYVADHGNHCIKMFSPRGDYLDQITTKGGQEPLKNPVSIHVNSNDQLFVGEEKTSGLSVYDSAGKYLTQIPAKVSGVYGITTNSQNCVYISDRTNRRVQIFK
jgi:sugar lactone lactonase YvrE